MKIKVADEVWIGCALLHIENPQRKSFSGSEIANRIKHENIYGSVRIGVQWHIGLHCVANKPANPARYRMLYELPDGTKRLFKTSDNYHYTREDGKITPEAHDIPQEYQYLLKWYKESYNQGQKEPPQPMLNPPADDPPESALQIEVVMFSNEHEMMDFSYRCPDNSNVLDSRDGSCKKCQLFVEEDEVKKAIAAMLKAGGWTVNKTALGQKHGVDIEATHRLKGTMLIEAKGEGSLNPMRVNYFLMVIGELIQKMDSPNKQYGIGLPAYRQYASLTIKLPRWIKQHLKLKVFLVKRLNEGRYAVGYMAY